MANFPTIRVLDINGETMMQFLKLGDNQYYGGPTCDLYRDFVPGAYQPHMFILTTGMLDLIAQLARLENSRATYRIEAQNGRAYNFEQLGRRMSSTKLASILGVDEQTVRDHYMHIVLIDDPEAPDGNGSHGTG